MSTQTPFSEEQAMKLDKNAFDRWTKWAERIKRDIIELVDDQQTFDGFREVVASNAAHIGEHHGRRFCDFVRRCYGVQAAVGIRRHLKEDDNDSISLLRLMKQIHMCAGQFTREFYLSVHPDNEMLGENATASDAEAVVNLAEDSFSLFSRDGRVIDEDLIAQDMKTARDLGVRIKTLVDRQFAHCDKRECESEVTYDDLHKMIDRFDDLACKYLELITGESALSLKREVQFNWKEVFRVPLDART